MKKKTMTEAEIEDATITFPFLLSPSLVLRSFSSFPVPVSDNPHHNAGRQQKLFCEKERDNERISSPLYPSF